ncbi:MAG: hypothetical protein JWO60_674 [Frankiales bacterium]|nr:hypothetical protein [Frankiales bacterium]
MLPRPLRPAALVLAGAASLALLSGCSLGSDAFNSNIPDDQPVTRQQQVVRTPGAISPDLPYETPPLVRPLPGVTGGPPGDVPTSAPSRDQADGQSAADPADTDGKESIGGETPAS